MTATDAPPAPAMVRAVATVHRRRRWGRDVVTRTVTYDARYPDGTERHGLKITDVQVPWHTTDADDLAQQAAQSLPDDGPGEWIVPFGRYRRADEPIGDS